MVVRTGNLSVRVYTAGGKTCQLSLNTILYYLYKLIWTKCKPMFSCRSNRSPFWCILLSGRRHSSCTSKQTVNIKSYMNLKRNLRCEGNLTFIGFPLHSFSLQRQGCACAVKRGCSLGRMRRFLSLRQPEVKMLACFYFLYVHVSVYYILYNISVHIQKHPTPYRARANHSSRRKTDQRESSQSS